MDASKFHLYLFGCQGVIPGNSPSWVISVIWQWPSLL